MKSLVKHNMLKGGGNYWNNSNLRSLGMIVVEHKKYEFRLGNNKTLVNITKKEYAKVM